MEQKQDQLAENDKQPEGFGSTSGAPEGVDSNPVEAPSAENTGTTATVPGHREETPAVPEVEVDTVAGTKPSPDEPVVTGDHGTTVNPSLVDQKPTPANNEVTAEPAENEITGQNVIP